MSGTLILIAILATLLLAVILLAVFIIYKISEIEKLINRESKLDKRTNRNIAKKIDDEASEKIDKFLKTAAAHLQGEIDKQISQLSATTTDQAKEITKFVKDQQSSVVRESQLMVANIVLKAQKEAQEYRKNQIERLEGQVSSIVAAAAREVLGRMISITEHEDLVKQALERAKKDRFFAA